MKYTVGDAWAILKGRKSGNKDDAYNMLNTMRHSDYKRINKTQGRVAARVKSRVPRVGDRPDKRWSV